MRIAYFINQYPKVSHSFIRREILAVEKMGHDVIRMSLRSKASELVDSQDLAEHKKTSFVLDQSLVSILLTFIFRFFKGPASWLRAFALACKMGWRSEKGLLLHWIYLIEASVIARWVAEQNADLIHAHFGTNSAAVALLASILSGKPYSLTIHGSEEFDKPQFIALPEKIKHAAFVAGVSSFCKSQILRWTAHRQWKDVIIVRCGIDEAFYNIDIPSVPDVKRLVCVGRLCEQKGQLLILDAMKQLHDEGIDFELVFAGDGEMRPDVEHLIEKHHLQDKATITGWITSEQVRDEIQKSRAMLLPSFIEGLPVVIMEAMALKRPVISTYVAGIPELVKPGVTGWLFPPSDVDSMKNAIREVLATPITRLAEMGEQARQDALSLHHIDTEVAKLVHQFKLVTSAEKP